jgi:MFS superfamily sulfate permease-like transporter
VASSLGDFLKNFSFPDFGAILNPEVWIVALTLAVVASLETLLSVEATDKLDPYKRITNTNRELVAQGTGNLVSGLIGGLPVTQVIVRSSANIQSGGKTKLATILHGFMLLICVAAIPDLLNLIPLAALAAVLFSVGYKLAKPSTFKQMYRLGWSQFLPYMATIAGVVFTDLLKGIAIGLVVAVIIILRNSYKNSHFLHKESGSGNRIKMTLAEEVIFLNKGSIARELRQVAPGTEVTIDMSNSITVDYDVLELIKEFKESAKAKNITVEVITKKGEKPVKPEKAKQSVELRLYNN